jgi:hypothetical protein
LQRTLISIHIPTNHGIGNTIIRTSKTFTYQNLKNELTGSLTHFEFNDKNFKNLS